jgi:hypothetical protein
MPAKPSPTLVILTGLLLWAFASQLLAALSWGHASYQLTEWMINYAGGFVRRGLPGSLIGICSDAIGVRANHLIIAFSASCYLLLVTWLLRRSTRTFPAALILSCIVMGFPAYQDSVVRKDCLGLLLLVGCLAIDRSRLPRPAIILALNLLAGVAVLSHETFVFYALAGFVLFRRGDEESPTVVGFIRRGLVLLPAAGCFLLTVVFHGTPGQAEAVNDSWLPLWRIIDPGNPGLETPSAAIQALGWSSAQGLSLSLYLLTSGLYQPTAWAMVFATSFGLVILFTGQNADCSATVATALRVKVTALLLAQLAFISPLFLLGVDYGRWLFLWVAATIILHTEQRSAPVWLESCVARLYKKADLSRIFELVPAKNWYLLFFGVPVCWNLFNFLTASPVSRHLHLIWSFLR